MSQAPQSPPQGPPTPGMQLMNMLMFGDLTVKAIQVFTRLGVADHLAEPATAEQLAPMVKAHAPSLHRLLRGLSVPGIVEEMPGGRFQLTPMGQLLRSGVPGSLRTGALMSASPFQALAWSQVLYAVQTGKPGFEKATGQGLFEYFAGHPDESALFDEAMVSMSAQQIPAIMQSYDFGRIQNLIDLGGGRGHLLAAVLQKHASMKGAVYELPSVVAGAKALLSKAGVADRANVLAGDLTKGPLPPADGYVMKHIVHGFDDGTATRVLQLCRKGLSRDGKLLLIEMVLPPEGVPHPSKLLDLTMMVIMGGQERTEQEYGRLLDKAGFKLSRVIGTQSPVSIVEAVPA